MKPEQMKPERWRQIEALYLAALEREVGQRAAFLAEACAEDEALRREVESLLRFHEQADNFIEAPALEVAAQLLAEEQAPSGITTALLGVAATTRLDLTTSGSTSSPVTPVFVGNYRILRKLGEGGMGVVYEAEQQHPRRLVALKVIRGGRLVDKFQIKLFQREVQALARLKHPGIAAIYESGLTADGQHYFAMELVRGDRLLEYVKGSRLAATPVTPGVKQRLELFLKLCDAISYAHQRGVIHRDLKPANILVADESADEAGGQRPDVSSDSRFAIKVLDFGLARITDEGGNGATGLSGVGQIKGTLPYMSPEQIRGDPGEIDVRTDVYTLGVILYELLTERLPYELGRVTLPQAIRIICEETPKPLDRVSSKAVDQESNKSERIDRDVATIVFKALEKAPEQRYQSVAALARDVERYLTNQPIQARPPSALYQLRKLVARHKASSALLATVFLLLLGLAITMSLQSARLARERDNTKRQEQANYRLLYAANLNLAAQALETLNYARKRELLENYLPQPGREDLRGFEWYLLWRFDLGEARTLQQKILTLKGHKGIVRSIAFSPDGKRLSTGSDDGTAKLWEVTTGQELLTFKAHTDMVESVAFSPDGKRLVTGSWDRTVKLWDVVTGQELTTLKAYGAAQSVAFSPDGKRLAAAGGSFNLWDAVTGQEFSTFKGHKEIVGPVAFSPDGKRLATGGVSDQPGLTVKFLDATTVKLWDATSGQELLTLKGNGKTVMSLAFSPDGMKLATGSADGTAKLWDVISGKELLTLRGHRQVALAVVFSPDGKRLATGSGAGSGDGTVKLWDVVNGQELITLKGHQGGAQSVVFSPDGKRLAMGLRNFTVELLGAATEQEVLARSKQ